MVVTRWTAHETHLGTLHGIPPTGQQVRVTGMTMEQYCDGRPQQSWLNWDGLGLMQQLGILPSL
jgi:predicted ester cyclase